MAMNVDGYLEQLKALMPQGLAWPREPGKRLSMLLRGIAEEFSRIDARVTDLRNEADPRTTLELLAEWEDFAGLPDICVTIDQTIAQRRAALESKLLMQGGQSRQYFIDLAASMGYPGATIDEYQPMTCNNDCNDQLWSEADRFVWQINLPSTGATFVMSCDDTCNDSLQSWGDEAIECRINRYKPAHTKAIFAYF